MSKVLRKQAISEDGGKRVDKPLLIRSRPSVSGGGGMVPGELDSLEDEARRARIGAKCFESLWTQAYPPSHRFKRGMPNFSKC